MISLAQNIKHEDWKMEKTASLALSKSLHTQFVLFLFSGNGMLVNREVFGNHISL